MSKTSTPESHHFKVVYFFAGEIRHGDIGSWLKEACKERNWTLELTEVDILRDEENHNLMDPDMRKVWLDSILGYDAVICTPPCSSF